MGKRRPPAMLAVAIDKLRGNGDARRLAAFEQGVARLHGACAVGKRWRSADRRHGAIAQARVGVEGDGQAGGDTVGRCGGGLGAGGERR
ncbi:hypothetical protein HMPREF9080_00599 [Cardiobacterium valvarum F0432]|uniref:Uncharacterized protein n=1 Tax=Cardiobacterium valvarum F0432 TaxID=797473 RepID=G9ZCX0_9GAMM|nr:hypothetical protein HMPREF9080_00599 [Cardiobacterium valvarum F0432]